jgi:glucose/arabinose dehydrogenase
MNRGRGASCALRAAPLAVAILALAGPAAAQFALPTDFDDELVVAGLDEPVGMAFLPDGRLFVIERASARVRLVVNDVLAAVDPVVIVPDVDASYGEEGLLGIAVDPGWPARPFVYLQYTIAVPHSRIARFTVAGDLDFTGDGSLTIDPASRYDVIEPPRPAEFHNGGTLRFGPDGMLYSSLGDATACNSQLPGELLGKIARLDVSGLPPGPGGPAPLALISPGDNPYASSPDPDARLVWHFGLRNPFRFGFDPETGDMIVGDVGGDQREELNYASLPGRNFQWPIYEGDVPGRYTCVVVDSTVFAGPIVAWDHAEGSAAMGGVLYRRSVSPAQPFPPEYDGDIFYADFYGLWLRRLKRTGGTWSPAPAPGQPNATDWGTGADFIPDWVQGADGMLWYCRLFADFGPGEIRRIRYVGTVSVPEPVARPVEFGMAYPIPSRGGVTIDFAMADRGPVSLTIHDAAGRRVRTLVSGEARDAGPQRSQWDGHDDAGRRLAPGVYLARLSVAGQTLGRRLVLIE